MPHPSHTPSANAGASAAADLYRTVFQTTLFPTVLSTYVDGRIIDASDSFLALLGFDRTEVIGRTSRELDLFTAPSDREDLQRELARDRVIRHKDLAVRTKTGDKKRVLLSANILEAGGEVVILSSMEEWPPDREAEGEGGVIARFVAGAKEQHDIRTAESAMRESEERLRWALQGAGGGAWDLDLLTGEAWWSDEMYALWGIKPGTDMVMQNSLALVHDADRDLVRRRVEESVTRGTDYRCEFRIQHAGRGERWMVSLGQPIMGAGGRAIRLLGISLDITERKLAEQALRGSEERLRLFTKHAPASIAMFDRQMRYLAVSNRWMADYHLGTRPIIGISHYEIFPEIPEHWKAIHRAGMEGEVSSAEEDRFERADGSVQWLRWEVRPWHLSDGSVGGIIIMSEDITVRKEAEDSVRTSLHEKEVLLKEIHHRVKNNLQIISSLLSMQAGGFEDLSLRQAFIDSRNRVRSMALVHEKLYRSENLASIDFSAYLREITMELQRAYQAPNVQVMMDVEPIHLEVDTAVPCGLIVNEIVSNAFKHAFTGGRSGVITVSLRLENPGFIRLSVGDDGVGLPPGLSVQKSKSMGMTLINALVSQIDGAVTVGPGPGTHIAVVFPGVKPDAV